MSGISGVFSTNEKVIKGEYVAKLLYENSIIQDKRGQAGAGIVLANPKRTKAHKDRGPARESIPLNRVMEMSDHTVNAGITHNMYSKDKFLKREDIHPISVDSKNYEIHVVSDGIVLDKCEKRQELEESGYGFNSNTSAAVIGTSFAKHLDETGDEFEAGAKVLEENYGSGVFSSILLVRENSNGKTKLVLLKDKTANKPIYIAEGDDTFFVNSETFPLERNGLDNIQRVNGGDVIVLSDNGIDSRNYGDITLEKPCIFEIIYFGNPDNRVMETLGSGFQEYMKILGRNLDPKKGPSNYTVRNCLGLAWCDIWKDKIPEPELISPVVISGTGFTHGIATGYDANPRMYIPTIKTIHALKTYQISDPAVRKIEGNLKMRYLTDILNGMRLLMGDDSIVRGGVGGIQDPEAIEKSLFSEKYQLLISQLKHIGKVEEISKAISYAPMFFQCYFSFGNNMEDNAAQDFVELPFEGVCQAVSEKMDPEWGKDGRFKVMYNPLENIYDVCGTGFCTACADGNYPIREEFIPGEILARKEKFEKII